MWTTTRSCSHARGLLANSPGTTVITADMREPDAILADPDLRSLIDVVRPVAVLFVVVLSFIQDTESPAGIVKAFRGHHVRRKLRGVLPSDQRRAAARRRGPDCRGLRRCHITDLVPHPRPNRPALRRFQAPPTRPGPPLAIAPRAERHHAQPIAIRRRRETGELVSPPPP